MTNAIALNRSALAKWEMIEILIVKYPILIKIVRKFNLVSLKIINQKTETIPYINVTKNIQ